MPMTSNIYTQLMSPQKINSVVLSALMILSLAATGATFVGSAAAQTELVQEDEISVDGSTVTVNTNGANSIAVEQLPAGASISDISDGGTYNSNERSILWIDFGSGLPNQVTFTLTPSESTEAGATVEFTVDDNPVSLDVVDTFTFDFGIELQQEATVSQGSDTTISTYPDNLADNAVSSAVLELTVDQNGDGAFTDNEVVASRTVDFSSNEYRNVTLTYSNVELASGKYEYQAQISKDGETATSYTTGTLTVSEENSEPEEPPETPSIVEENTVSVDGSTITINTDGQNSIDVSGLPAGVEVSDVSDSGTYNEEEGSILFINFGSGLPDQVTFTLTPSGFNAGEPVKFTVGGTQVALQVTETTLPDGLKDDSVSGSQYSAVVGEDGNLNSQDLSAAINSWSQTGSINGVEIGSRQLSALINYWSNN